MIKHWLRTTFLVTFSRTLLILALPAGQLLAEERMQLDDTSILGSRELPKITYIVPWKNTEITGMGNLSKDAYINEMQALDREIFRKELDYFSMLQGAGRQTQQ